MFGRVLIPQSCFLRLAHPYSFSQSTGVMSLRRSTRTKGILTGPNNDTNPPEPRPQSRKRTQDTAVEDTNAANRKAKKAKAQPQTTKANRTQDEFKVPAVPSTPRARRTPVKTMKKPPMTPTPSLIKVIAPYSSGDIDDATPPPLERPVEPHRSNATLLTPNGTQHTTYENIQIPDSSPSKTGLPRPTSTSGTLLSAAEAHLCTVDPRMIPLVAKHHCRIFSPEGLAEEIDPFRSLASGIMAQQVSGAAAKSIKNKFVALFHTQDNKDRASAISKPSDDSTPTSPQSSRVKPLELSFPTPAQVAATSIPRLREAGLSERKAEYIQGLAEKFTTGDLSTSMLLTATDEEVMSKLIAVRGLGKWSVEMFACFGLKRMDVFSTGDLGVQRGMAAFMGRDVAKLKSKGGAGTKGGGKWKYMSEQEMVEIAEPFRPYRSLFMWLMWRVEDVDVEAVENA